MRLRTHALPGKTTMLSAIVADPAGGGLLCGVVNTRQMTWRFDLATERFEPEPIEALVQRSSYSHRSLFATPDGRVYAAYNRVFGIRPETRAKVRAVSPSKFRWLKDVGRRMGDLFTSARVLRRDPGQRAWVVEADLDNISIDLAWDEGAGRWVRLSPRGVTTRDEDGREVLVHRDLDGFVHELVVAPSGELLSANTGGELVLLRRDGSSVVLGSLEDGADDAHAVPGLDAVAFVAPHWLVGGTRNRARPFIVDLRGPSLRLLDPVPTAPRASAFAVCPDGQVYFAAGVGRVGLYRLDVERGRVEALGPLEADGVAAHHIHDLLALGGGRLYAGEFFPLDVPEPPWPSREALLWEIQLP